MSTKYHSQLWAWQLTAKGTADSVSRLSRALGNARVDLNPHQVDAALFGAAAAPGQGVILADEVGLGKTIEAGLILAQRWAERRRRLLVIAPASLRKQWAQELEDKFFLPAVVLETAEWNRLRAGGSPNPFDRQGAADSVVICSYQFAARQALALSRVPWDLVVIDEAHRLRNVAAVRPSQMAVAIRDALDGRSKVLLTATPLQNSLSELFGLVSVVDPHVFGDELSFKAQFMRGLDESRYAALRQRLLPICQRTLRRQVLEYVRFTARVPITHSFRPTDAEHLLYESVSEYLRRKDLLALPKGQRALMTMVLRKLLASSTFAIAGTLRKLKQRLEAAGEGSTLDVSDDVDHVSETAEEWGDGPDAPAVVASPDALRDEVAALSEYLTLAESIPDNAKGLALISALATALDKATGLGAARKAVVFTESRRTQAYLFKLLSDSGYHGQIVQLNGTNTDAGSKALYEVWAKRHKSDGQATGVRAVDVKAAVVEAFRDHATVLLATESAAEGINLQFCSLVVNYDLPWNPQRIEQRIGRCHRYGQKHDVVVVNFLNERNAADRRVHELLSEKLQLFEGVFGASDEVLGVLESGVDLERRIAAVYQECRTTEEIEAAFDALQVELQRDIEARMSATRRVLLDHFDEDVHKRLKLRQDETRVLLGESEARLAALTAFELGAAAVFEPDRARFRYQGEHYALDWGLAERTGARFFRIDDTLAASLVTEARIRTLPPAHLTLDYAAYGKKVHVVEALRGQSGWLSVGVLDAVGLCDEELVVTAGQTDAGTCLDDEQVQKLLALPAAVRGPVQASPPAAWLEPERARARAAIAKRSRERFLARTEQLDRWADDKKLGVESAIEAVGQEIAEARRAGYAAESLDDRIHAQRRVRELEGKRRDLQRDLFESQARIDEERDALIDDLERQRHAVETWTDLFTFRFTVV